MRCDRIEDRVTASSIRSFAIRRLGEPLEGVIHDLEAKGLAVEPDDMGATVPSVSVGLFAPSGRVEGVQLGSD